LLPHSARFRDVFVGQGDQESPDAGLAAPDTSPLEGYAFEGGEALNASLAFSQVCARESSCIAHRLASAFPANGFVEKPESGGGHSAIVATGARLVDQSTGGLYADLVRDLHAEVRQVRHLFGGCPAMGGAFYHLDAAEGAERTMAAIFEVDGICQLPTLYTTLWDPLVQSIIRSSEKLSDLNLVKISPSHFLAPFFLSSSLSESMYIISYSRQFVKCLVKFGRRGGGFHRFWRCFRGSKWLENSTRFAVSKMARVGCAGR